MIIDSQKVNEIYKHLSDEESKSLFSKRLAYSLVPSYENMRALVRHDNPVLLDTLQSFVDRGDKVCVYGIGNDYWYTGRVICHLFFDHFGGAYDKNASALGEVKFGSTRFIVQEPEKIKEVASNSVFIIGTPNPIFQREMYNNLLNFGIPAKKIIFLPPTYDYGWNNYFDRPFLTYGENEVLVDCGCYDGETSISFANLMNGRATKIIAYEPNGVQIAECEENLVEIPYAIVKNLGVWDKRETLRFSADGMMARINNSGDITINTVSLDEDLKDERVTFIKMDIEGAELKALQGAEKLILANRPKLAICVYHKPEDIIEIPEFIVNLGLGYRLYLRHQYLASNETVLFAVPTL